MMTYHFDSHKRTCQKTSSKSVAQHHVKDTNTKHPCALDETDAPAIKKTRSHDDFLLLAALRYRVTSNAV